MVLDNSQHFLLKASLLRLTENDIAILAEFISSVTDWDWICRMAVKNGTAPLVYRAILSCANSVRVPQKILSDLKQAYYHAMSHNMMLYTHFGEMAEAFNKAGIQAVVLKGLFLAEVVYGDPGLRPTSDIDLLVNREEAEPAKQILLGMGYTEAATSATKFIRESEKHFPALIRGKVSVEIHVQIQQGYLNYKFSTPELVANSVQVELNGVSAMGLSPIDLIQHLCIHLEGHLRSGIIQLRQFTDIVNVLEFYRNEIAWEEFEASCVKRNCLQAVQLLFGVLSKVYTLPVPDAMYKRLCTSSDAKAEALFSAMISDDQQALRAQTLVYKSRMNLLNMTRVKGFRNRVRFLAGDIFPGKAFMMQNYRINDSRMLVFYYIKRIFLGAGKVIRIVWKGRGF